MKTKTYVYRSYDEDFVQTADQGYTLPDDYSWNDPACLGRVERAKSSLAYGIGLVFGWIYARVVLHARFENRASLETLRDLRKFPLGCMLFCNHTQPLGDPFLPALAAYPRRVWAVVSSSNLAIPGLGKLLPRLGALPIPETPSKMREFNRAVSERLSRGDCVVVYPEAHVWPYCTFIRPFPPISFGFAVSNQVPVFSMTATYQSRPGRARPCMTLFLDGPFAPEPGTPRSRQKQSLCAQVRDAMEARSAENTQAYIEYRRMEETEARA